MKRKSDSSIKTLDGSKNSQGIRTRLSTGTLVMSGTSTVSLAEAHAQEFALFAHSSSVESDVSRQKEATSPSALKRKNAENKDVDESTTEPPKRRKIGRNDGTGEGNRNDYFCWICHKDGVMICCELCPRVFHAKCLSIENNMPQDWICPECEKIMQAECTDTRSKTMSVISVSTLCTLLRYALDRMRTVGSDTFERLVDPALFPSYSDYIFHPMSLSVLEKNIKRKTYGCTEAFLADAKWIYHNSMVFNGAQNKITSIARAVLKVCKHEMSEIEVCPDCYYNSCLQTNSDWFCEPCRNPHPLVWAKLKGYPFWPAKALRESNDQVDVRFFGAHDRSWVPVSSCFMLSKVCPVVVKKGRGGMAEAMREVEVHIKKLREKLGSFEYAPFQTPYSSDAVYSKLKSSSSGDGGKHAGHGKMGKSKTGEGRLGEKQSVVSKTAMALKSKYISMSSKKGGQQTGTVVKPGASQSQQVIYLKPMPKGVFLLSEQTIDPVAVQTTTHGTILQRNIPDLQLIKRISDKIQPEVMPSSSQSADSKTQKTCDSKKEELPQSKDAASEMETDAVINSGHREALEKGEVTLGETREKSPDVRAPATDVTLSATDIDSSVTNIPLSVTNMPLSVTAVPLSATDKLLRATNVPISPTDVPSSTIDIPLSTKAKPLPVSNTSVQNSLLPENLEMNTNVSDQQLGNSGSSRIVSSESDKASGEEIGEHSQDSHDLENQKQDEAGPKIDSSIAEEMKSPAVDAVLSWDVDAVEVPSEDQHKSSSIQDDCAVGADVNRDDSRCTSVEVSVPLSISSQASRNQTSDQSPTTDNNVTTNSNVTTDNNVTNNSNERSSPNLHEDNDSASATDAYVGTICQVKSNDANARTEFSDAEQHARIVSPTKDHLEQPSNPIKDTVRTVDTGVCVSEPAEKEEQSKLTQLCESDGRDSVECTQNVSAASPSPCLSSISISSSSNASSTSTSIVTASPGSIYKDSLQKVIDSCKAKLGIDDKNLNNGENDVVMLEGDDEDDSIVISDNEFDDDSDVLLMDIDEHSEGPSDPVPTDVANCVAETHPGDAAASFNDALPLHPAKGNVEQADANLRSEILAKAILVKDIARSPDKSISSTLALEKTNTAELEKNTSSDRADISIGKITGVSFNMVAGSFKDKDDSLYTANGAPATTSFVSVISRNQSKTAGSDFSTDASTNKPADSNPDVGETISMQFTSQAETLNAVSREQTHVRRSVGESELKQAAAKYSSEAADGTSFMSLVDDDDDEYDSSIDDNMTLDMDVVCSDGPEESSDEDTVSDDEVIQVATTDSLDKNSGGKTQVSGGNSMQSTLLPPGRIIIGGKQNSRDTSSTVVNYTTLRGALTAPSSSFSIHRHSKKCPTPPTSAASTSTDSVRGASGAHPTYIMSKLSQNTEVGAAVLLQQKTLPRILSSKYKRIAPAPASGTVEITNRGSKEKQAENPGATPAVELNGNEGLAGSHLDPARQEGSTQHQPDQPAAMNASLESLVKNRYSVFEKFMMEQLNEMAMDVKKATEMSLPQLVDKRHQEAIDKLQEEYTRKYDDLKKTMYAALKESLANFKLHKERLADKLREEFYKELQKAVADTKRQQWCAECWKEALYYCCWNTSYCSYQCQQKHWPTHMAKCMQTQPQPQGTSSSSQSPTIISTLNTTIGTNRSNISMTTPSLPSSIFVVTTTPSSHPTTTVTSMTSSKAPYRVPTVSIVSPSQWKATEEVNKTKKLYSLVSPQPTSASISTLSIGPPHFQIQYLQPQGTAGPLPQQVQVVGANPSPVPLLVPSMMTPQNQNAVASPVHLLQNTSMLPLMQRQPQTGIPQQAQPIGAARYIIPSPFGTFMRPGGPV